MPNSNSNNSSLQTVITAVSLMVIFVLILFLNSGEFERTLVVSPLVPPPVTHYRPKDELEKLGAYDQSSIDILTDFSRFDLRSWKPVPTDIDNAVTIAISPTNYTNYLRVVKQKPIDFMYAHYGTSGARIDLQCNSHKYSVLTDQEDPFHTKEGEKTFVVKADISKEPVGKSFIVVIEATYWNGFRSAETGDAATYIYQKGAIPHDLSLLVLFPPNKPCRNLRLKTIFEDSENPQKSVEKDIAPEEAQLEPSGQYAYWNIRKKEKGHHYQMIWDWPEVK